MYYTYTCTLYNVHYLHYRIFRDKLEPLGVDTDLDKTKLTESRKASEKKAVKKAYEEAILHRYIPFYSPLYPNRRPFCIGTLL